MDDYKTKTMPRWDGLEQPPYMGELAVLWFWIKLLEDQPFAMLAWLNLYVKTGKLRQN